MGKGHAPRQGRDDKAFAAGYDGIDWGRKEEACQHNRATYGDPWVCMDCGFKGPSPFGQQRPGWPPGLLQDDSYPLAHALSSKPDARQHVRDVAAQVISETTPISKLIPTVAERLRAARGVGHPHDFYQAEIAELRAALDAKRQGNPVRITGNFRCKVNGMDVLNDAGFEILTQPGFDYVLEAIEPPAKTCQHCKHWESPWLGELDMQCTSIDVLEMLDGDTQAVSFNTTADFGCNRWEPKP